MAGIRKSKADFKALQLRLVKDPFPPGMVKSKGGEAALRELLQQHIVANRAAVEENLQEIADTFGELEKALHLL